MPLKIVGVEFHKSGDQKVAGKVDCVGGNMAGFFNRSDGSLADRHAAGDHAVFKHDTCVGEADVFCHILLSLPGRHGIRKR